MLNSKVEKPGETKEPRQNKWVKIQTANLQPGCPPFGASITYTCFFFFFFYKGDTSYQWKTESLSTNDTESLSERIKKILTLVSNHI